MGCDLCAPTIPPKEGSCLVQCSADAVLKFLTRGPTYDVSCLVCVQLVGLKKKRFELCPIYAEPFLPPCCICSSLTLISLSSLHLACHLFPAWFSWSQLGVGNGRSGWERLAGEERGFWQMRSFPQTLTSSPPPMDPRMPPEDPAVLHYRRLPKP